MKTDIIFIGHNQVSSNDDIRISKIFGSKAILDPEIDDNHVKQKGQYYAPYELFNKLSNRTQERENAGNRIGTANIFSAAIAYLGTYVTKRGFTFDFINSFADEKDALKEKLEEGALTVGISTTLYLSPYPIMEIIEFIRKYNSECKIIVAGPFIFQNKSIMEKRDFLEMLISINGDYYIDSFQGETALVQLLAAIKERGQVSEVMNLYYRKENTIAYTYSHKEENRLEEEPIDWALFKNKITANCLSVRTSCSCCFSCSFCTYPVHAGKYQVVNLESIEREFDGIKSLGNIENIFFIDDTFNVPIERFKEILKMMIYKKYNFKWCSYIRCQFLDQESVQLMKQSGCKMVFLGIESGSQAILDNMNKKVKVEDYIRGHELLNKNDIITYDSFIVGFPGETEETVGLTIDFINSIKPSFYRLSGWFFDKKSPIANQAQQYSIKGYGHQWKHATMDSDTAYKMFERIVSSVSESVYTGTSSNDIFQMLYLNMSLPRIKEYLSYFNEAVKERKAGLTTKNISPELFQKIQDACVIKECFHE